MHGALRTRVLPLVMWAGTMAAVAWLWLDVRRDSAVGFALGVEYTVAPPLAGRLDALAVAPGQRVRAGQVVATLDPRAIDAELAIVVAERGRLEAELGAVRSETSVRLGDSAREHDESVAAADLALQSARADRNVRAAEFKALSAQTETLTDLVARRMADRRELDALSVQHAALQKQLQMADTLVQQLIAQVAAARARRALLPLDAAELALGPVRAELAVITRRQEQLALQRDETVLRAPADGEVAAVLLHPGEVAAAGAPVLTIVGHGPGSADEIAVCLPETKAGRIHPGEAVTITPRGASGPHLPGHVTRMGPHIAELPPRCRRNPAVPEWGREITVALDEHTPLLPGQAVQVAFLGAPSAHTPAPEPTPQPAPTPASEPAPALVASPTTITIPPALAARSRFEPSALVWVANRDRFVVASDDTGHPERDEHAPWLFTMDTRGQLDPEPLVITGLEAISDVESLAPGPGDSLYLLASQSRSRKGKRPPARQVFARLNLASAEVRADASTRLASLLDAAGPARLAELGLADTADLDIEGMTATAAGGLLLGLKQPLDDRGQAIVWHLPRPDVLLAGDLNGSGLTRLGAAALQVIADGKPRAAGISDLLELPDGSLLLASTASGDEPGEQDGALWHARRDLLATPNKLRSFPGLKPEGLALRADGAAIVVVFDTGAAPPRWMELPWPAP